MMDFSGKTVLLTGATSGIGEAIARAFIKRNADLVLTGRRTLPETLSGEKRIVFIAADITEPGTPDRLVAETVTRFGKLDILVNNAGILFRGDALACSDAEWDLTLATNVTAAFRLSRAALRVMQPRRQ